MSGRVCLSKSHQSVWVQSKCKLWKVVSLSVDITETHTHCPVGASLLERHTRLARCNPLLYARLRLVVRCQVVRRHRLTRERVDLVVQQRSLDCHTVDDGATCARFEDPAMT